MNITDFLQPQSIDNKNKVKETIKKRPKMSIFEYLDAMTVNKIDLDFTTLLSVGGYVYFLQLYYLFRFLEFNYLLFCKNIINKPFRLL